MMAPRLLLLGAVVTGLAGCARWQDYRGIPAGADAGLWRPQGVANADFDAQTAFPADLSRGRGTAAGDAQTAVNAVDRVRREHPVTLPASSISHVGQSGAAAPAQP